jgi:alanine dehydrogenase
MTLYLTEADVRKVLTMPLALELVEESFRRVASGAGVFHPRRRLKMADKGFLNYMAAADMTGWYMGLKIYTASPSGVRFMVPLFDARSGELKAQIEADYLGQMRTGAATGVATRWMARENAQNVGIIGCGLQARTQLEAVSHARKLRGVKAFSRDAARREEFAKEMTARLGVTVTAAGTAEETVRGADIVITATTSKNPVLDGAWIERGTHLNAVGVNFAEKRELDAEAVRRSDVVVADSREQSKMESGDLIQVYGEDGPGWANVIELAEVIGGKVKGRTSDEQITLFKSNGIAIEDIVVAGRVYEMAKERGLGREVAMFQK